MKRRAVLLGLAGLLAWAEAAPADVAVLSASKDNSLYEDAGGVLSNGAGQHTFTGVTAVSRIRRAVMAFDVAGSIPPGSTISSAVLTLHMSATIAGPTDVTMHRLTADWGEGTSDAPDQEGQGAASAPGDATWIHRSFNTTPWTTPGGDFNPTASATTSVEAVAFYSWSGAGLTADVQDMLDTPASNFGWIVVGDESTDVTAKRFDSREIKDLASQPKLTVTFDPPTIPTVSQWGTASIALSLASAGTLVFARRMKAAA